MKFKDYKCRKCGKQGEYMFGDSDSFPREIPEGCECGGDLDLCVLGAKVHLPAHAQAVKRNSSIV